MKLRYSTEEEKRQANVVATLLKRSLDKQDRLLLLKASGVALHGPAFDFEPMNFDPFFDYVHSPFITGPYETFRSVMFSEILKRDQLGKYKSRLLDLWGDFSWTSRSDGDEFMDLK